MLRQIAKKKPKATYQTLQASVCITSASSLYKEHGNMLRVAKLHLNKKNNAF